MLRKRTERRIKPETEKQKQKEKDLLRERAKWINCSEAKKEIEKEKKDACRKRMTIIQNLQKKYIRQENSST